MNESSRDGQDPGSWNDFFDVVANTAPRAMMMVGHNERSNDGYKKAATIDSYPGFETWENEPKEAQVTALVANRFIVTARGRNVDSVDIVRSFVQSVDLAKLATLK